MKKRIGSYFDVFVVSGFFASLFYSFLNPLYISLILSELDVRVIAFGSFMSSAFPVLIGLVLGKPKLFERLYRILPVVMIVELVICSAAVLIAAIDLAAYYLATMFILGIFSASVVYLMQKIKEVRYRRGRAAFDRRCGIADSGGAFAGSALSIVGVSVFRDPLSIAVLGALQTVIVYGLFIVLYRKAPQKRRRAPDEEPHPLGEIAFTTRLDTVSARAS
jgi:hypothetical protein